MVDSWDDTLLSGVDSIHIPVKTEVILAFQCNPLLSMQYTSASLSPGDIMIVTDTDTHTNSKRKDEPRVKNEKGLLKFRERPLYRRYKIKKYQIESART